MEAGRFDRKIQILVRGGAAQDTRYGTATEDWGVLATVWAEIKDVLPSRADRVAKDISIDRRPSRIRMHWRDDVTQANRIRIGGDDGEEMRIIAGPAMIGRRQTLELMVEALSTEGEEV
jgi:head-tail adaptor